MANEETVGLRIIEEAFKLPMVKVDRRAFLIQTFQGKVSDIEGLIEKGPQAFLSKEMLDREAQKCIQSITLKSSAVSLATGLPGGIAMAATILADILQFFGYSLRLAQEISYIYGFKDLMGENGELSEEAKNTLILYLGIMLGVTSAGSAVRAMSGKLSTQALKKIPQKALTQTLYYPVIKRVLGIFGTKLTKNTFAKGISKAVPVVGGVVSGGINYLSMKPMATKLQTELGKNVAYTEESLQQDLDILEGEFEEVSSDIASSDTVLSQLERLSHLLEKNMITEEEFQQLKQELLKK